jgi:hypothetical protein
MSKLGINLIAVALAAISVGKLFLLELSPDSYPLYRGLYHLTDLVLGILCGMLLMHWIEKKDIKKIYLVLVLTIAAIMMTIIPYFF